MARCTLTLFVVLSLLLLTGASAQAEYQFVQEFGSSGTGPGQFQLGPSAVAVDSSGNVWATSYFGPYFGLVEEFSGSGVFIQQFGSTHSAEGAIGDVNSIAIDHSGNVFVAQSGGTAPVMEFNSSGDFIRQIGTWGPFGAEATGDGELYQYGPNAVATDSLGNVWVADTYDNRIEEFSSTGQFIRQVGSLGSGDGQLHYPTGIAVDTSDNVWVADTNNDRIEEFSSNGAYISQVSLGIAAPQSIAIDASGNIFVAHFSPVPNSSVEEFTSSEALITQFGSSGKGTGQIESPQGIAVDAFGNVWVADRGNNRIEEFSLVVPEPSSWLLAVMGLMVFAAFRCRRLLPVFRQQRLRPHFMPSRIPRSLIALTILALGFVLTAAPAQAEYQFVQAFGSYGSGDGQLAQPSGLAVDSAGNVWVADTNNNRIDEFSSSGAYIQQFGTYGTGNGQFTSPTGIAIDSSDNIWVADAPPFTNRIQEFSNTGQFIGQISCGADFDPANLALDGSGNLWASGGLYNSQSTSYVLGIEEFDSGGSPIAQFTAERGVDFAFDSSGNIWLAGEFSIYEYSPSGVYLTQINVQGVPAGGIAIDHADNIWVTTVLNGVEEYNSSGVYVTQFGSKGSGNGQFLAPTWIAIDASGNLWVLDTHRIQEFSLVPEPPTIVLNTIGAIGLLFYGLRRKRSA